MSPDVQEQSHHIAASKQISYNDFPDGGLGRTGVFLLAGFLSDSPLLPQELVPNRTRSPGNVILGLCDTAQLPAMVPAILCPTGNIKRGKIRSEMG